MFSTEDYNSIMMFFGNECGNFNDQTKASGGLLGDLNSFLGV